ncbi:UV damage endonuclease UvsE [Methylobacterium gossipiicola]|uniref:UV DNA damage repair endonuclease n=1 Tax=Methylobacterium gossipiicola TaxID=582675 RepID=A0A1I2VS23_9HYPH|nr:UV damage endonuclease UvsE [Methylobacterium gossipiicola]SFG92038.1 UV DNA damage repair endonuclease [Methylobacterium gossipiicola]
MTQTPKASDLKPSAHEPDGGPRLGFCCKFILEAPPESFKTLKAAREAALEMNLTHVTMANLARLAPAARRARLEDLARHNLAALERQIAWVAARPPIERLLRMASNVLPGYTHEIARDLYAEPGFRSLIEPELARIGDRARAGGVRLSFHPGQFCVIASRNPGAQANGIAEFEYHAEIMALMGYGSGWHPHGAHINIHVGARDPGVEGFRANLSKLSRTARDLITVENDENHFGLDTVLRLADVVPVVLDLHHHWVESGGAYLEPDDPRIARVRDSWRGVRPVAHISVSREALLEGSDPDVAPDFAALAAAGHNRRDLAAHSDMMWNRAVNALVGRHLAWADFEIEAKGKNHASGQIAGQVNDAVAAALAAAALRAA